MGKVSYSLFGIGGFALFFSALGFFVYDGLKGALAVFILTFVLELLAIFGLVPILGNVGYFFIGKYLLIPKVFSLTGIYSTWLSTTIFWFEFGASVIISIIMIIFIIKWFD